MLLDVLSVVRVVLHRVVAFVAPIALLCAVEGQMNAILLALLERRRTFMALVAFFLHHTISETARINEVRIASHAGAELRIGRRCWTRLARLDVTSMNDLVLHQILCGLGRVVALRALESVVRAVKSHVVFKSIELEVSSRALGAREDLIVVLRIVALVIVRVALTGARCHLDDDPGDAAGALGVRAIVVLRRLLVVRLDAGRVRRRVSLRVTVQRQQVTRAFLILGGMCFLMCQKVSRLSGRVRAPLTRVRELRGMIS